ncbi:MAG: hypothetical protein HY362_00390 [Candidatus Aenigmarchaeota archaeon]|nr:hypothetical protein [Candidatus Aenigmarchaeota archaeon]
MADVPVEYKIRNAKLNYDSKASRLEALIIRPIWIILIMIVGSVYSFIYYIIVMVYMFVGMILGAINGITSVLLANRLEAHFNWGVKTLEVSFKYFTKVGNYFSRRGPYMMNLTDQRPPLGMEEDAKTESGASIA